LKHERIVITGVGVASPLGLNLDALWSQVLAGATAVGMGTALFVDPRAPGRVIKGLTKWVERQGVKSVKELVGQVEM